MKKVLIPACVLMLLALQAQAKTVNIEYILDASGSMNETVNGEMKIEIARKTLTDLVEKLPSDAAEVDLNVGLRIYGHRTGASEAPEVGCKDTALEVPIRGVDTALIKGRIAGLKARGRTPIAYSLLQAKDDFPPAGEGVENIIILVSDGKETCGGDPCATAKELHASGIKVKIHVVGFDIKREERAQLECIAKAAGGTYFAADSAASLSEALNKAQEQVLKKESTSVRIKAAGPGKLRFNPAGWVVTPPYQVEVVKAEDGKKVAEVRDNLNEMMLPAGSYRLVWRQWQHGSRKADLGVEFTISPGKTTTYAVDTGIHLVPAKWIGEPPYYWYLKDVETGKEALRVDGKWDAVPAPAGIYELWYRQWQHKTREIPVVKSVTISKGKVTEVDLNTGVKLVPSDQNAKPPYSWVLKDKETGKEAAQVSNSWGPIPMPPGSYSLSIRQTQHGHSLIEMVPELPVKKGQLVEIEI